MNPAQADGTRPALVGRKVRIDGAGEKQTGACFDAPMAGLASLRAVVLFFRPLGGKGPWDRSSPECGRPEQGPDFDQYLSRADCSSV